MLSSVAALRGSGGGPYGAMLARRSGQTMAGRPGTPDEVASPVEWLLGADSGWVTGQVLSPNGGVVLGR